jgi:hypothetical protein
MGLDVLLARLEAGAVTPVTPAISGGVTRKPAPALGCTPVTPDTAAADVTAAQCVPYWRLRFADGDPVEVTFAPPVDKAGALALYPAALAAEALTRPASSVAQCDANDEGGQR